MMAEVFYGSNQFERLEVDLDETLRLCLLVFRERKDWRLWIGMSICADE